jgi:hypothetical protein
MPGPAVTALLAEMKGDSSVTSLIALLRIEGAGVPAKIRTVGLTEALSRVGRFVRSKAVRDDLRTLVEMRDGIVHAAEEAEVEERILTAFVQQADGLLEDLSRERADFWDGQLFVVDALLKDASNKLAHRVEVRLAAAAAMLERRYASEGEAVVSLLRTLSKSAPLATRTSSISPITSVWAWAATDAASSARTDGRLRRRTPLPPPTGTSSATRSR